MLSRCKQGLQQRVQDCSLSCIQIPGPKAPPFPLILATACGSISQLFPSLSIKAAGNMETIWPTIPPLILLFHLVYFSNFNFVFLKKQFAYMFQNQNAQKRPYSEKSPFHLWLHPLSPQLPSPTNTRYLSLKEGIRGHQKLVKKLQVKRRIKSLWAEPQSIQKPLGSSTSCQPHKPAG